MHIPDNRENATDVVFTTIDVCVSNIDVPETIKIVPIILLDDKIDLSNWLTNAVSSNVSIGSRSLITWTNEAEPKPNPILVLRDPP